MDEDNAEALGFKQPPNRKTTPCLTYMARVMELREFIAFVFSFVKTSAELAKLIPDVSPQSVGQKGFQVLTFNFSNHRPLVNQVILSRAVETFDLYLTTILRDVFVAKPEMLKSEQQVDARTIIDAGSYEELILKMVERKVHELGYKSLTDLRKYVTKSTGIDPFESEAVYEMALVASEVRNLIAHNNCVVNAQFQSKTKGVNVDLKQSENGKLQIDDEWLRKACYALDGIVFRFDEFVSKKFDLPTL